MRTTVFAVLLALGCSLLLAGCGQKGPLVMPPADTTPAAPR